MKRFTLGILVSAALAAAGNASAQKATAATAETSAADPDRVICRVERPTGSKIGTKICKRASVWEEEREASRRLMENAQQRTGTAYGK